MNCLSSQGEEVPGQELMEWVLKVMGGEELVAMEMGREGQLVVEVASLGKAKGVAVAMLLSSLL